MVVFLKGDRLKDVDQGDVLRVTGRLQIIEHPPAFCNGVQVPAWTEVRVVEE